MVINMVVYKEDIINDKKISDIIELVLEYVDIEIEGVSYCGGEPDIECYPYLSDSDKKVVKKYIKDILEE